MLRAPICGTARCRGLDPGADWRRGELLILGKGGRQDMLPLPADVGEALVSCLRRRPRCQCRALFLRVTALRRELNWCTVGWVVRGVRPGLPRARTHCLRHTAATQTQRRGVALDATSRAHVRTAPLGMAVRVQQVAIATTERTRRPRRS